MSTVTPRHALFRGARRSRQTPPQPLLQSCHVQVLPSGERGGQGQRARGRRSVRQTGVSVGVPAARVVFPEPDRAEIAAADHRHPGHRRAHARPAHPASSRARSPPPTTRPAPDPGAGPPHAVAVASGTAALEIACSAIGVRGPRCDRAREHVLRDGGSGPSARRPAGLRRRRPGHVRAQPAHARRGPHPEHGRRRARAHRRADHARTSTTCGGCARAAASRWSRTPRTRTARRSTAGSPARSERRRRSRSIPTKVVTSGEGGMILTASADLAQEARIYRDQGKGSFGANHHVRHGYAWRMSELQRGHRACASAPDGASSSPGAARSRRATTQGWPTGSASCGRCAEPPGCREQLLQVHRAAAARASTGPGSSEQLAQRHDVRLAGEVYDLPLHLQPVLAEYASGQSLPVAEDICRRHVCLPVHSDMRTTRSTRCSRPSRRWPPTLLAGHGEPACASR